MQDLPASFQKTVIGNWGEEGKKWLKELPSILEKCAARWHLTVEKSSFDLSYSFVTTVKQKDGSPAVLKLCFPDEEYTSQRDALKACGGHASVLLLDAEEETGALLLEHILPGTKLTEVREKDDEKATLIAAQVIHDTMLPLPQEGAFVHIAEWKKEMEHVGKKLTGTPLLLQKKALELFTELNASKKEEKLLHGDLHYENILLDEKRGWLAIDPKGVIADPAYSAARLLNNCLPKEKNSAANITKKRVEILSSILGESEERIVQWAFFDAVLRACWSREEGDEEQAADGFSCAEVFDSLL